jgi:hypothetical protein
MQTQLRQFMSGAGSSVPQLICGAASDEPPSEERELQLPWPSNQQAMPQHQEQLDAERLQACRGARQPQRELTQEDAQDWEHQRQGHVAATVEEKEADAMQDEEQPQLLQQSQPQKQLLPQQKGCHDEAQGSRDVREAELQVAKLQGPSQPVAQEEASSRPHAATATSTAPAPAPAPATSAATATATAAAAAAAAAGAGAAAAAAAAVAQPAAAPDLEPVPMVAPHLAAVGEAPPVLQSESPAVPQMAASPVSQSATRIPLREPQAAAAQAGVQAGAQAVAQAEAQAEAQAGQRPPTQAAALPGILPHSEAEQQPQVQQGAPQTELQPHGHAEKQDQGQQRAYEGQQATLADPNLQQPGQQADQQGGEQPVVAAHPPPSPFPTEGTSGTGQAALFEALHAVPWDEEAHLPKAGPGAEEYAALEQRPEPAEAAAIRRDLARTFPQHLLFSGCNGEERLGRLLRAYVFHDPETGYCQGQGGSCRPLVQLFQELSGKWAQGLASTRWSFEAPS